MEVEFEAETGIGVIGGGRATVTTRDAKTIDPGQIVGQNRKPHEITLEDRLKASIRGITGKRKS